MSSPYTRSQPSTASSHAGRPPAAPGVAAALAPAPLAASAALARAACGHMVWHARIIFFLAAKSKRNCGYLD